MKKFILVLIIFLMGLPIIGCDNSSNPSVDKMPQQKEEPNQGTPNSSMDPETKDPEIKDPGIKDPGTKDSGTKNPGTTTPAKRELTKKIEVKVEGVREMREAKLQESKELGYSLYILDGFSLESEEPGKDILLSEYDGTFFARIEKLDNKTNIENYKKQLLTSLGQSGKVTKMDPKTLSQQEFRDSEFCYSIETGEVKSGQTKTSLIYLVKKFNGQYFAITFHIPLKEAAEGLAPSLWSMVSTLETR